MHIDWRSLARDPHLAIVVDLDGTLIPFAPTPHDAPIDDEAISQVRELAATCRLVIVTGRPRALLTEFLSRAPEMVVFAEYGAWRWDPGVRAWIELLPAAPELDELEGSLRAIAGGTEGALIERKQCSVDLHYRIVAPEQRDALVRTAELEIDAWLEAHSEFERILGASMIEVRHRLDHKGTAISWLRAQAPDVRVMAIGDDFSDEDMFRSLRPDEVGVIVGADRPTVANVWVAGPTEVRALLAWIALARGGADEHAGEPPETAPAPRSAALEPQDRLLVISNRMPSSAGGRGREVGGLVAAIEPALETHQGVWLGWSGRDRDPGLVLEADPDDPSRVHFDYPPGWRAHYYGGFCNRGLWPLVHGFQARAHFVDEEWSVYRDANAAYARFAHQVASPTSTIWVHDYQLLLVASELRKRGHTGSIGLFLHTPFPPRDDLETCPWARQLLEGMLAFDLIGFQTVRWRDNFAACVRGTLGRTALPRAGVFPVGIEPDTFAEAAGGEDCEEIARLRASLGGRALVLGVDRLDYSKGIPERLDAFARMLELEPRWRGKVSFVQVSVPSRADVPEYAELRDRVENLVGHINGLYGEADWVPVQYLYRSYERRVLAQLYRLADVAMITPLRDGLNLVAKEFVASQDDDDPGVLMLSRFAGASEELDAALVTNPYHRDGMACDLSRALELGLDERRDRQRRMRAVVERSTASAWAQQFLAALNGEAIAHASVGRKAG